MNIFVEDLKEELRYYKNKEQRLLKILLDCKDSIKLSDHEVKPNIQRALDKTRYKVKDIEARLFLIHKGFNIFEAEELLS